MQYIYLVFLATNYRSGKIIRRLTHSQYNHVAISFSPYISKMYSYARRNYYEPIVAGYVNEYPDRYLLNNKDTIIKICKIPIKDDHYKRIKHKLHTYDKHIGKTQYNWANVLFYPFGINCKKEYMHTCISFFMEIMECDNFVSIKKLESIYKKNVIYEGELSKRIDEEKCIFEESYFKKRNFLSIAGKSIISITKGMTPCLPELKNRLL